MFGMNFQAFSVGQKLIEASNGVTGGYLDAAGTPSAALLDEFKFVDASIGAFVDELKERGSVRLHADHHHCQARPIAD